MLANQKSAIPAPVRRHVTIGDSTVIFLTSSSVPDRPDDGSRDHFHHKKVVTSIIRNTSHLNNDHNANTTNRVFSVLPTYTSKTGFTRDCQSTLKIRRTGTKHTIQSQHTDEPQGQARHRIEPVDHPNTRLLVDSFTGWPISRSESLESRDNPFLPDGELCREAEDLLSRAIIVRDNFCLDEIAGRALLEEQQEEEQCEDKDDEDDARNSAMCQLWCTPRHVKQRLGSPPLPGPLLLFSYDKAGHSRLLQASQGASTPTTYTRVDTPTTYTLPETPTTYTRPETSTTYIRPETPTTCTRPETTTTYIRVESPTSGLLTDDGPARDDESQSAQSQVWSGSEVALIIAGEDLHNQGSDNKRRNKCCSLM